MYEGEFKQAGKLLRQIRKENHLSAEKLAAGIISYSSLNKFEVGKNHLTFLDLARILKRMNVDLDSFYERVSDTKEPNLSLRGQYGQFLREMSHSVQVNDLNTMETNAKELQTHFEQRRDLLKLIKLVTLASAIKESGGQFRLKETVVEQLEAYFMSLENWNNLNLSVFNNTAPLASTKMLEAVSKELIYEDTTGPLYSNILITLANIADLLLRRDQREAARTILGKIKQLLGKDEPLLLIRFKVQFLANLLDFDIEKAKQKNQVLIDNLRDLGADSLASSYDDYLNKYKSQQ